MSTPSTLTDPATSLATAPNVTQLSETRPSSHSPTEESETPTNALRLAPGDTFELIHGIEQTLVSYEEKYPCDVHGHRMELAWYTQTHMEGTLAQSRFVPDKAKRNVHVLLYLYVDDRCEYLGFLNVYRGPLSGLPTLELVGGGVDEKGATPEVFKAAAIRELEEETGYTMKDIRHIGTPLTGWTAPNGIVWRGAIVPIHANYNPSLRNFVSRVKDGEVHEVLVVPIREGLKTAYLDYIRPGISEANDILAAFLLGTNEALDLTQYEVIAMRDQVTASQWTLSHMEEKYSKAERTIAELRSEIEDLKRNSLSTGSGGGGETVSSLHSEEATGEMLY